MTFARKSIVMTAVLLAALAAGCKPQGAPSVKTMPGAGQYVIMDEMSLWHSPTNSGVSYSAFEPLHVRREGAEYFPRTNAKFANSGARYGEIRLTADDGGIMYLPRYVAYDTADVLSVMLRQKSAKGVWRIAVYPSADSVAYVSADTPGVSIKKVGDWNEVSIPFAQLKAEPFKLALPAKADLRNANYLLSQYDAPKGEIYALGFSLLGGKADDSLFIDKIVLIKPVHTAIDAVTGRLTPPVDGAEVVLRSDKGDRKAAVAGDGTFSVEIPAGATMVEVVAETDDKVMSPRSGRFMEIGSYVPAIEIPTEDGFLKKAPAESDTNSSLYVYDAKYGPRMTPMQDFLTQISVDGKTTMASEVSTNAYGYIDRDREHENPDKALRIMVLGECHHMGVHIAQADGWWNEAEAVATMLSPRPVEVISASFNYASFTSAWPAFRDLGKDVSPDVVLLPMIDPGVLNLTIEEYMMDWLGAAAGHRPAYQFELSQDGKIVHKPNDPDWQLYKTVMPEAEQKRIRAQYTSYDYVHADPAKTPQWVLDNIRLSTASLAEFTKLAKARGQRVAVLYISNFGSSKTAPIMQNGVTYDPTLFRGLMRKMAEDAGMEFIDVSEGLHMSMEGKDADRIFYHGNGHFTAYGHYRYGQVLGNLFSSWSNPAPKE